MDAGVEVTELFRNSDLLVRSVRPPPGQDRHPGAVVVTFDSYNDRRQLDRLGFGERFLLSRGVRAIHVISRDNDWYQYAEMAAACSAIREAVAGVTHILTYGSSMGAYAAIRFADWVGATSVLALSPQYSIHRRRMPDEIRWRQEAQRIKFRNEIDGTIRSRVAPFVVFDPFSLDGVHADRIAADIPINKVALPGAGHPVGTCLNELGLLEDMVFDVLEGRCNPHEAEKTFRRLRPRSSAIWVSIADKQPLHRKRTALRLARRAAQITPDSDLVLLQLGRWLSANGEHEAAVETMRRAAEKSGRNPSFLHPLSVVLEAAGDREGALAIAREHLEACPGVGICYAWMADLLQRSGRSAEALDYAKKAAKLDAAFTGIAIAIRMSMNPMWRSVEPYAFTLGSLMQRLRRLR